jgi:hypothetical protein
VPRPISAPATLAYVAAGRHEGTPHPPQTRAYCASGPRLDPRACRRRPSGAPAESPSKHDPVQWDPRRARGPADVTDAPRPQVEIPSAPPHHRNDSGVAAAASSTASRTATGVWARRPPLAQRAQQRCKLPRSHGRTPPSRAQRGVPQILGQARALRRRWSAFSAARVAACVENEMDAASKSGHRPAQRLRTVDTYSTAVEEGGGKVRLKSRASTAESLAYAAAHHCCRAGTRRPACGAARPRTTPPTAPGRCS